MVISVLDHVARCYTWQDGAVVGNLIGPALRRGEHVTLSFAGVNDVPSSFVNAAFVSLLESMTLDDIRRQLRVVNSTRQINDMVRRRLVSEASVPLAA